MERLFELVNIAVAGQEGHTQDELDNDGTDRPHVDGGGVVARAPKQLGRTVPPGGFRTHAKLQHNSPRDDLACHLVRRVAKLARETKVCNFELAVGRNE